ncbi:MAG: VCBS repeat-containing protein, partial [Bacteroidota bacterium]
MRPCFAALVLALASPLAAQPFTPVVVDTTATGSGPVVWADLDGDGRLDLIKNSFYTHALVYRGGPHGTWTRVEGSPLSERPDMTLGLAVADIDNDGDLDLFESTANHRFGYDLEIGSLLWRNMRGTFTRTETGPLGAVNDVSSNGGAWADYDADGDLDLMVAVHDLWSLNPDAPTSENVLFENTGAGAFRRNTTALPDSPGDADLRPIWADYDGDGDLDLSIPQGYFETAPAHRRSDFFRNQLAETGSATFQHDSTSAFTRATTNTTSLSWVDYDNDGDLDLYLCAFAPGDRPPTEAPGLPNQLWTNVNGTFVRATEGPHVTDAKLTTGHIWLDADNDGDLDLFGRWVLQQAPPRNPCVPFQRRRHPSSPREALLRVAGGGPRPQ